MPFFAASLPVGSAALLKPYSAHAAAHFDLAAKLQSYAAEVIEHMLGWALTFLVIAILAAIFGFTGVAAASAGIAKLLFFVFLVVFLVTLIMSVARRA